MQKQNPLLQPFDTAPFSQIKNAHFKPAFEQAIANARAEIDTITANTEAPTFENTIEALEFAGQQLDRISSIFFNLNSAETNDVIQAIAQEVSPLLSEFGNDITLNEELFKRVKIVYENKNALVLTPEQQTLLDKKYKSFSRNGANLPENKKQQLRDIDKKLAKLKLTFGENVLAETNKYTLHITDEKDLAGLPDHAKEAAAQTAEEMGKQGWVITLQYPSYIPFMTYADNRELRKKLAIASGAKGFQNNEHDNQKNVLEIAKLRHQRAQLLGYNTHAHFVLEERMAENPQKVEGFLQELLEKAKPAAKREFEELSAFAKKTDDIDQLQKWDSAYYTEKLKQERFDLDDEKLKPYFKLENVIEGAFTIALKLYGIKFTEVFDVDTYQEDVKTFRVKDTNGHDIAIFYADFHPRPGKRGGAWMTSYKPQYVKDGKNERPHISIVCNFTKPGKTKPSLLTFNEVTTLFHEFGHALHGMLANTTYPSLSGTSVFWDFVELPSQILENWCYEKEALELFAKHYETGESLPMELIEKIKASFSFMEGMQTLRQLSFGLLDMGWHGSDPSAIKDVKTKEENAFGDTQLFPDIAENCMSTSFSHIFQGGYSSGYYSYKWAEVLDADAFAYFMEKGIFNSEVAAKFKEHILSKGGIEHPMTLYKRFRGKEPNPNALLKRAGLIF
ncbi:MAG: peptidase M3 [Flavobacteriaceae bacterium CG2_30_34_30]|nr:MAG: peptidase M3 [Flavobacteriaceae bacterium CG2_30_34_30]PIQ18884.1 MAG: peptidase M3 [Flavobacteriaceae bacterium CG18_big_fil_WC_8_21_14_2_50_34_36]PIV48644.1 MAG: peptidase M3 [Flavobacteriaceae bacterium CG02_land_8_20_14_3_00_34_13]PIZ08435.1 MAG: peptidase M3 [Flavobacteriaceae bacterium CG_4_10_14_0_8_um_filter_34_31]PJC06999.1 MAG: peptidase M3 [Flavobacteriaceae bacterium CG_4_9_14_0_8_um_filter_34_30]